MRHNRHFDLELEHTAVPHYGRWTLSTVKIMDCGHNKQWTQWTVEQWTVVTMDSGHNGQWSSGLSGVSWTPFTWFHVLHKITI